MSTIKPVARSKRVIDIEAARKSGGKGGQAVYESRGSKHFSNAAKIKWAIAKAVKKREMKLGRPLTSEEKDKIKKKITKKKDWWEK